MSETPLHAASITPIAEEARIDFLPRLFGSWYLRGENTVYAFMGELCSDYQGGYWEFFDASNGARFMAPAKFDRCHMACAGNGFGGTVSAEAAGIIATLFALSHLSFSPGAPAELSVSYGRLYELATQHDEAELIFRAID